MCQEKNAQRLPVNGRNGKNSCRKDSESSLMDYSLTDNGYVQLALDNRINEMQPQSTVILNQIGYR